MSILSSDMRRFMRILDESAAPPPDQQHLLDAIEHADNYGDGWTLADFDLHYEGEFSVDELSQFDDPSGWIEADSADDLQSYRNGSFAQPPGNAAKMPPIIVITAPNAEDGGECITQVGDGRGRVNFANVYGHKLHVWHLVHKSCDQ